MCFGATDIEGGGAEGGGEGLVCVFVFNMCFSTGKLARPQGEGGLGFLGGFSITRGVELAPSKKGGRGC